MQQGIPLTLQQIPLLELPAKELLARFGSGGHKPGSGSAAALVGVLSCKLILTVISLTKDKEKYQQSVPELRKIENTIKNKTEVKLIKLFEEDSKVFDLVISARRERDRNEKGSVARKLATKEDRKSVV